MRLGDTHAMLRLLHASLLGLATTAVASAQSVEVLEAIPFRCETAWTHHWAAERPEVAAGTIVVVRVDPDAIRPRAAGQPILMVGDEIAEIVNPGNAEGIVVAVVPAPVDWKPGAAATLAGREVFLSAPGLPDRIDVAGRSSRRDAARAAGVRPQPAPRRAEALPLADRDALDRELAVIVRRRCPDQSRLADRLDGSAATETARPASE